MSLSARQKKYLRSLAHSLPAVVQVGQKGVSSSVLAEINQTLNSHELIKIRIQCDEQAELHALLEEITAAIQAELVQVIGHTVILYRPAEEAKISLPR